MLGPEDSDLASQDIQDRLARGDRMVDAVAIAEMIGGPPETTVEWVRRNWPNRYRLSRRKVRWWLSDVARCIAERAKSRERAPAGRQAGGEVAVARHPSFRRVL